MPRHPVLANTNGNPTGSSKVRQTTKLEGNCCTGSGDYAYYDVNGNVVLSGHLYNHGHADSGGSAAIKKAPCLCWCAGVIGWMIRAHWLGGGTIRAGATMWRPPTSPAEVFGLNWKT
ncbi:MAG: hypothetical protein WB869_20320 [Candidatus Acidiferrales bacterium]